MTMIRFPSLLLFCCLLLPAQAPPPTAGGEFHYYDAGRSVTIKGVITTMDFHEVYGRNTPFLLLGVKDAGETIYRVEVCPQWFYSSGFYIGQRVSISGALSGEAGDAPYIIAREIQTPERTITLRDPRGFPMWSRQGFRGGRNTSGGGQRRGRRGG